MFLQQALYGSEGGGHAFLLGSDDGLTSVFKELLWSTDLPATAPNGTAWSPFLRCFPHGSYYVVIYTSLDLTATRTGMVFSRAVLIPLDELESFGELATLVAVISQEIDRTLPLSPIKLAPLSNDAPFNNSEKLPPGLVQTVNALTTEKRRPIVFIGQQGFEEAMLDLWSRLPIELRKKFCFRLSFGPQDIEGQNQWVVCTPESLSTRWSNYPVVFPCAESSALTLVAAALINSPEGRPLRDFAIDINVGLSNIADLPLVESAYSAYRQGDSAIELTSLLRLLTRLCPDSNKGSIVKDESLKRLASILKSANASEIRALRNLELNAFLNGSVLWKAVSGWAVHIEKVAGADPAEVARILVDIAHGCADKSWTASILEGIYAALQSGLTNNLAKAIWLALTSSPQNAEKIIAMSAKGANFEEVMCVNIPTSFSAEAAILLVETGLNYKCYKLAGSVMARAFKPAQSITRYLSMERGEMHTAGIQAALGKASPIETLAAAIQHDDSRIIEIAAKLCAENHTLLQDFDPTNPVWYDLLCKTLELDGTALEGLPPINLIAMLVLQTTDGNVNVVRAWAALSKTSLADLSAQPGRREIWASIPLTVRPAFFLKTAAGWIQSFLFGRIDDVEVETVLVPVISEYVRRTPVLQQYLHHSISRVARYLTQIDDGGPELGEQLVEALDSLISIGELKDYDAAIFGKAIFARRWEHTARSIASAARRRSDFRPMLHECVHLLGFFERISLQFFGIQVAPLSENELWYLLEEVASELYPTGPNHNELWSRARGREQDLSQSDTGGARWHRILKSLRAGSGGTTPAGLVSEMLKDYSGNERLRYLSNHYPFN